MKVLLATVAILALGACNYANAETVTDVNKTVILKKPYQVEVCTDRTVSGDKSGDMLKGAIIGGLIGNNVTKNVDNGGAVGAVIGGILGHNNSKATGGTRRVCSVETRYNEEQRTVYSHSIVTFTHNGRQYSLQFQKQMWDIWCKTIGSKAYDDKRKSDIVAILRTGWVVIHIIACMFIIIHNGNNLGYW